MIPIDKKVTAYVLAKKDYDDAMATLIKTGKILIKLEEDLEKESRKGDKDHEK